MDPRAFDRLACTLAHPATRRRALAGLLGAALAVFTGPARGDAKRRRRRASAVRDDPSAGCVPPCGAGLLCCQGVCQPPSVLERGCPVGSTGFLTRPNGRLRCAAADHPACDCLGVYRACAPGTRCQLQHGAVICTAEA